MALITLTTDFGLQDFYAAAVVGELKSRVPEAEIITVSHQVQKFDVATGALLLRNCWRNFPVGTIHLVSIFTNNTSFYIALEKDGHFFLGADNGFFNLMLGDESPDQIYTIDLKNNSDVDTFPTKDIFVPAVTHLAKGGSMAMLGRKLNALSPSSSFEPIINPNSIRGSVLYVDSYFNSITNIKKDTFISLCRNRTFEIMFRDPSITVNKISNSYYDVEEGDIVAIFGSTGLLEIAINQGKAAQLLRLTRAEIVMIEFYD